MTKVNIVNQHTANRMVSRVIMNIFKAPWRIYHLYFMYDKSEVLHLPEVIPAGVQIYTLCLQILCVFHSILERWDGA